MSRARRAALRAVKIAAAAADHLRRPAPGVVVLIYHRIGGRSGLEIDLPTALFDEQMALLAEARRPIRLGDALDELRLGRPPPGPAAVAVTFDDGTADFVEHALPVLVKHAIPATLYVATSFVESGDWFPDEGKPVSWNALADACSTDLVDVGSHTHRHLLLDRAPRDAVVDELDRSIGLIEQRLGRPVLDFAYPKAVRGSGVAETEIRARFRSAAVGGTRANAYGATDAYRLARSPVQVSDGMTWFNRKVAGGMGLEDGVRRRLNRIRYADSTT